MTIYNLDENIGLPRVKDHAKNIEESLRNENIAIEYIPGGFETIPNYFIEKIISNKYLL